MKKEELYEEEVVETNEVETKTVKNLKVSNKMKGILITGLTLVVLTTGILGFKYATNRTPDINISTGEVITMVSENSVVDEVIGQTTIDELDQVSAKVELSERLHNLNLQKYIGDLVKLDVPETYSVDNVNAMIDSFEVLAENNKVKNEVLSKESREFTELALLLEAYERCVNGSLSNDAYKALVAYAIPEVKAEVADACGFDASDVAHMKIGAGEKSYVITFTDPKTGKEYNVKAAKSNPFSSTGYVYDVIDSIYNWQDSSKKANDTGNTYDAERNNDIKKGVDMLKTLTIMDCEITDKGVIKTTTPMSTVKDKVKEFGKIEK